MSEAYSKTYPASNPRRILSIAQATLGAALIFMSLWILGDRDAVTATNNVTKMQSCMLHETSYSIASVQFISGIAHFFAGVLLSFAHFAGNWKKVSIWGTVINVFVATQFASQLLMFALSPNVTYFGCDSGFISVFFVFAWVNFGISVAAAFVVYDDNQKNIARDTGDATNLVDNYNLPSKSQPSVEHGHEYGSAYQRQNAAKQRTSALNALVHNGTASYV
jgi:uncharacterized membrane protein (DUF485 family)